MDATPIVDLYRFTTSRESCGYLPQQQSRFDYRIPADLTAESFGELLRRGWRRFGLHVFRPICEHCRSCRSIRVVTQGVRFSKSQRRTLKRNSHIDVYIQPPSVSLDHIELYNAYHADMTLRRGWPERNTTPDDYFEGFIGTDFEFAREILYVDKNRLVGVGLVDITPAGLSSIYFFHAPEWREEGPGTFSALMEIDYARQLGLPHVYLGYWIKECPSMNYKARYTPHELLTEFVADDQEPHWAPPDDLSQAEEFEV